MTDSEMKIKLSYITGLKPVVLDELKKINFEIISEDTDSFFIEFSEKVIQQVKKLRSVARVYLVMQGDTYHPTYISNHKSVLAGLINMVIEYYDFKTFKISCAGSDSPEVRSIARYIRDTYILEENDEADLKIHIIKLDSGWEMGVQITPRPLSVRDYRVVNMSGAMDPTIAYAVNSFCNLDSAHSYLNIFSGSATLLIEAGQCYPNLNKLLGFDNEKKHLSLSVQNIKKAGLIERVQVKELDIFDKPDLGKFDAIASDLPFGMSILKGEDLEKLYETFIQYCEDVLNTTGRLVVYTSEYEIIEPILLKSKFKIIQSLQLKFITNVDAYLRPKIIVCEFK
ncbi:MAG TPA: methyltransferase domain-containing protein [Parcubacteria group bacterium]|jgi:23S rRNA G2445 N2-methylase RlmL|nr:methyltransferase domain-containing protein [Parcubacteria group bacterium]